MVKVSFLRQIDLVDDYSNALSAVTRSFRLSETQGQCLVSWLNLCFSGAQNMKRITTIALTTHRLIMEREK